MHKNNLSQVITSHLALLLPKSVGRLMSNTLNNSGINVLTCEIFSYMTLYQI